MKTRNGKTIGWSSANLPTSIAGAGGVSASFAYGPDRKRKWQMSIYAGDGDTGTETTTYVGDLFEIETTPAATHYKHFIPVPGGTKIIYDLYGVNTSQTTYMTADHLGSGNLVINAAGSVLINESYSAYGYRRSSSWAGALAANSSDYSTIASTTRRGYTDASHEMLDNVNLIHMNGRVYDPVIGRFLSTDRVISKAGNSQSLNPYGYVENLPLRMTDPTGFTIAPTSSKPVEALGTGGETQGDPNGGPTSGSGTESDPNVQPETNIIIPDKPDPSPPPASPPPSAATPSVVSGGQSTGGGEGNGRADPSKPQPCKPSAANNPNRQRNIGTLAAVGFATFAVTAGAIVLVVAGPEAAAVEGAAYLVGGRAMQYSGAAMARYFLVMSEPVNTATVAAVNAGAYGAAVGGAAGAAIPGGCH